MFQCQTITPFTLEENPANVFPIGVNGPTCLNWFYLKPISLVPTCLDLICKGEHESLCLGKVY